MKIPTTSTLLLVATLLLTSCNNTSVEKGQQENTIPLTVDSPEVFKKEYAHVVYFWFKNPDNIDDRALFEKSLRTFLDNSAYAKTQFIGIPPTATRDVVDDSFTYNLVVSFESATAQQAYQEEVPHKKFIDECAHLWEKVIVYDANSVD